MIKFKYFIHAKLIAKNSSKILAEQSGIISVNRDLKFTELKDEHEKILLESYNSKIKEIEKDNQLIQKGIERSNIKKCEDVDLVITAFNRVGDQMIN